MSFNFNPLPRKEGDQMPVRLHPVLQISIHSLVKRETSFLTNLEPQNLISIHSLVKRETQRLFDNVQSIAISIHSLVKRETIQSDIFAASDEEFQSTPS